ncbi:MAG: hypothetical protein WCH57_09145 [Verrucomicrobiota bacterium]
MENTEPLLLQRKATKQFAMLSIESFYHSGPGYTPFLIRPGWQVAQLNYLPELAEDQLHKVERHKATDEVFICFKGISILVGAVDTGDGLKFEAIPLQPGVTYNVPKSMWHWIVMYPGDQVMLVERAQTHCDDVEYRELKQEEVALLRRTISMAKDSAKN